ncbi:MAG TPA: DUF58 domain-containing protein, partial [Candidatus Sumerlaeota bacterium]|nr:DUF58 domain-containing protein [Candidatus Sumerlaeota bacterium]HPS03317.1 DUF58 domain-containing protein [Candidatus Sumerlaeota bacterium]
MPLAATEFPNRTRLEAYARQYHLVLPERQRASLCGDLTGRRTGSSVEYQDRKDYVPGDDVRHVDWRAYARNDRLTIKLYREEISPRVDIFVDTSLSMSVTEEKALRRTELAYLFALLSRKMHAATRVWNLGEQLERVPDPMALLAAEEKRQDTPLPLLMGSGAARGGGIKILISDLLFPCAPPDLAAAFAQADRTVFIQVLSAFEAHPTPGAEIRLEDAETGGWLDVRLDRTTVEGYRKRLENWREEMERLLRLAGGVLAVVCDEDPLEGVMRQLLETGVVNV